MIDKFNFETLSEKEKVEFKNQIDFELDVLKGMSLVIPMREQELKKLFTQASTKEERVADANAAQKVLTKSGISNEAIDFVIDAVGGISRRRSVYKLVDLLSQMKGMSPEEGEEMECGGCEECTCSKEELN